MDKKNADFRTPLVEDNVVQEPKVRRDDHDVAMRRALMKRMAVTGFLAPALLVTLLKKPAAASV